MMFKYVCLVLFITWYQLSADGHPAKTDVRAIDSMVDKETEAFLSVEAEQSSQKNVRDKRTVGFLRQLFPGISQIVDRKIQQITRFLFRVIGRLVLRGGAAGAGGAAGGGGAAGDTTSRRISITLPTYPPSTDDEEEDQDATEVPAVAEAPAATETPVQVASETPVVATETPATSTEAPAESTQETTTEGPTAFRSAITQVTSAIDLRIATEASVADSVPAESAAEAVAITTTAAAAATTTAAANTAAPTTVAATAATVADVTTTVATITTAATAAAITTTNGPTTLRPSDSDNTVSTGIVKRTARDVSAEESSSSQKKSPLIETDDDVVSPDNVLSNAASDDASSQTADVADEDPRNKRFLLNGSGGGGGGGGGSGGGSGNFLFDLIRLVAGSGANQDKDESSNVGPVEAESAAVQDVNSKEDGYSVGVPGPLTRIFVIANRGVANLVQDLILRLAQTTERIVNFKARLITSLI